MAVPVPCASVAPEVDDMRHDSTRFEPVVHLPVCVGQFVDMFEHGLRQDHVGQASIGRRVMPRRQVADSGATRPRGGDGPSQTGQPRGVERASQSGGRQHVGRKPIGRQPGLDFRELLLPGNVRPGLEQLDQLIEYRQVSGRVRGPDDVESRVLCSSRNERGQARLPDVLGHAAAYAVLGATTLRGLAGARRAGATRRTALFAALLAAAYRAADEFHQSFVPGVAPTCVTSCRMRWERRPAPPSGGLGAFFPPSAPVGRL